MPGIAAGKRASGRVDHRVEKRDEPVERRVPAQRAIHLSGHGLGSRILGPERAHRGLEIGHQQCGGKTLSGHVGNRETESRVREAQHVVAIAAERGRRFPHRGHLAALDLGQGRGQERALNALRVLELARGVRVSLTSSRCLVQFASHGLGE